MAEGRDLGPRSPRWVNALIWSTGLGAAACFIWQATLCDVEPTCMPLGMARIVPKVLGCAMLPLLLVVTMVGRGLRRVLG
jgi:hypothetical protein